MRRTPIIAVPRFLGAGLLLLTLACGGFAGEDPQPDAAPPLSGLGDPIACSGPIAEGGAPSCEPVCNRFDGEATDRWCTPAEAPSLAPGTGGIGSCFPYGSDAVRVSTGVITIDGHAGCCQSTDVHPSMYWYECQ